MHIIHVFIHVYIYIYIHLSYLPDSCCDDLLQRFLYWKFRSQVQSITFCDWCDSGSFTLLLEPPQWWPNSTVNNETHKEFVRVARWTCHPRCWRKTGGTLGPVLRVFLSSAKITGWWSGTCFIFPQNGVIIPIDYIICLEWDKTTNQVGMKIIKPSLWPLQIFRWDLAAEHGTVAPSLAPSLAQTEAVCFSDTVAAMCWAQRARKIWKSAKGLWLIGVSG